jgi:hypothetical protein
MDGRATGKDYVNQARNSIKPPISTNWCNM